MLLLAIGFFYGCSKSADMQTTPENVLNKSILSENVTANANEYKYIINEYREINPRLYIAEKVYFLKLLYASAESGRLIFTNDNYLTAFKNKIKVVYKMVKESKSKSAIQKIKKDLIDKMDKWIYEDHRHSVGLALEGTVFMLTTNYDKYYLNIDYFDYCDALNGYGWTQIVNGGTDCILQLEGNNNNYLNDPVFWILANLKTVNVVIKMDGAMVLSGDAQDRPACYCYDSEATCSCYVNYPSPEPEEKEIKLPEPNFETWW
jgi:hypothetical protein